MGILFLDDNAGIGCARWVLRAIVDDVARVLERDGATELAAWLTSASCPVELYSHLDVRELTEQNQAAFREALGPALLETKARGPVGWHDPSFWPGYLDLFEDLAEQASLLARDQKPSVWRNLNGISAYGGKRSGPGWDE